MAVLVMLLTATAPAVAVEWTVLVPTTARIGEPVRFAVSIAGDLDPTVLVYYRNKGADRYTALTLLPEGEHRFSAEVPASATRTTELRYYVEAVDHDGVSTQRLGTAEQPLSLVMLRAREDGQNQLGTRIGAALAAVLAVLATAWRYDRRRRRAVLDQLFWVRLLAPLARLTRDEAIERATSLAGKTLDHPVRGPIQLAKDEILEHLREVRKLDLGRLETRRRRFVGGEEEAARPLVASASDEPVEPRLSDLATRIGGLCAVGYLLARGRETPSDEDAVSVTDLVQPLITAREAMRRAEQLLEAGQRDQAKAQVSAVATKVERIQRRIGTLDDAQTVEDFARSIEHRGTTTADLLGRLIEYRALKAARSIGNRDKLLIATRTLAERDAGGASTPEGVRHSLARRGLLTTTRKRGLPPAISQRTERLRKLVASARPAATSELDALAAQVEDGIDGLGKLIYTLDGLAHAVALQVTLAERRAWLECQALERFDQVAEELDHFVRFGAETIEFLALERDQGADAEAAQHVDQLMSDLLHAVAQGVDHERDFYLDPTELQAARGDGPDLKWAHLVVRAAACRVAIDRLARRHARTHQREGQEPPALPKTLALGLIRIATQLEIDIQEHNEIDAVHGRPERVAVGAHVVNRLSRARLGLAVLGGLPATGFGQAPASAAGETPTAAAHARPAQPVGAS